MNIYKVKDVKTIENLFIGWEETMIYSYIQGYMGEAYASEDNQSAMIIVGDFCFLAGIPSEALLENKVWGEYVIMVPQNKMWNKTIEQVYPNAIKRERYATRKDIHYFNIDNLKENLSKLPVPYKIKMIDEELYHQILNESWSSDLCGQFLAYEQFHKMGVGFVVMEGTDIIAGVSSYTVYKDGIEIEIDTRKDKRRQGLARICASQIILECLNRNLYPSWDAHNQESLNLAQSLGYVFDKAYSVYEIIDK
ncbi:MAG: GNAT family N-acetyltransferase [Coprobacillus sp.]